MTILISEDQYEKLVKASLKRHAKDPEPNIEGGTFDLNGDTIKYSVFIRKDGYAYVYYSYLGQKHKVHIMPEESFIRLNKKEQEETIEFRIKKDIQKKSQQDFINESDSMNWVKRRANKESMKKYITNAEINFPTLCDDFDDEFEFVDRVINYAVDEFMTINEDVFLDDEFEKVNEIMTGMCEQWFGDYLLDIYRTTCSEENGY